MINNGKGRNRVILTAGAFWLGRTSLVVPIEWNPYFQDIVRLDDRLECSSSISHRIVFVRGWRLSGVIC